MPFRNFTTNSIGTDIVREEFPNISMFDASTFYNWEQDNIPLQQLKQRTDTLLRHAGYNQATAPDGVTLTLSSTENAAAGIYTTMADIMDLVPKRLTFPVQIEICKYGEIPSFDISDIVTEGAGKLEIINQNFGKDTSALVQEVSAGGLKWGVTDKKFITKVGHNSAGYTGFYDALVGTKSTRFNESLFSVADWNASGSRAFMQRGPDSLAETDMLTVWTEGVKLNASKEIEGSPYNGLHDPSITLSDVEPSSMSARTSDSTSLASSRGDTIIDTTSPLKQHSASIMAYGNLFRGVTIRGCKGDVKLTNICVDGGYNVGATLFHGTLKGFTISESDIVLQNCAVMRCAQAGLYINNSEVSIASGLIAYRNYEKDTGTAARITAADEYGIGLHAVNSNIYFATVDENTDTLDIANQPNERRNLYNFAHNDVGILLESSKLHGGTLWDVHGSQNPTKTRGQGMDTVTSFLQTYSNNKGIVLNESTLTYLGILDSSLNNTGIQANNSTLKLTQFQIEDNQTVGFDLNGSELIYGFLADAVDNGTSNKFNSTGSFKRAYCCSRNGQNIIADRGSRVVPFETTDFRYNLGFWGGDGHDGTGARTPDNVLLDYMHAIGASQTLGSTGGAQTCDLPAIVIKNNSFAEFVHLAVAARTDHASIKGACVHVTDNSKVVFRGTSQAWTSLTCVPQNTFGYAELAHNWATAAVYAGRNSIVEFTGPTKISRFGVPVLAEDNSTIEFGPPTIDGSDVQFDNDRFSLYQNDAEHTKVDLHSTRAGLVANRNSQIKIHHLGGWPENRMHTTDWHMRDGHPKLMNVTVSACTSAGYFRFLPNGYTSSLGNGNHVNLNGASTKAGVHTRSMSLVNGTLANPEKITNLLTTGGMCVRAVGNSNVDCNAVNWKFDGDASSTSGVFYDVLGGDRSKHWPYNAANSLQYDTAITDIKASYTPMRYLFDSSAFITSSFVDSMTNNHLAASSSASAFVPALDFAPQTGGFGHEHILYTAYASNLRIWNIADTSRLHMANSTINRLQPDEACFAKKWHGPRGKWANGVALDYFGQGGLATTYNPRDKVGTNGYSLYSDTTEARAHENFGIFRLQLGHRGDLKSLFEVSSDGANWVSQNYKAGGAIDQINAAGYQTFVSQALPLQNSDKRLVMGLEGGSTSGLTSSGLEDVFGYGYAASSINKPAGIQKSITHHMDDEGRTQWMMPAVPAPPLHMDWQGYMRNFLDESSSNVFTNAKHAASKKVNSLSIYRSTAEYNRGGEGRDGGSNLNSTTYGVGVRSLNLFDLDRLL